MSDNYQDLADLREDAARRLAEVLISIIQEADSVEHAATTIARLVVETRRL